MPLPRPLPLLPNNSEVDESRLACAAVISFRNSKLTHVLQPALSGSSKTLMFVNVNPAAHQESLSSLRFAAKVNGTEVGPAEQRRKAA